MGGWECLECCCEWAGKTEWTRLYGPRERALSPLHDNFDPSCFHTPVSNIVKQQLVNTLTESWYVDEDPPSPVPFRAQLPLAPLTVNNLDGG